MEPIINPAELGKHIQQELADNPVTLRERVSWWWADKTGKTAEFNGLLKDFLGSK